MASSLCLVSIWKMQRQSGHIVYCASSFSYREKEDVQLARTSRVEVFIVHTCALHGRPEAKSQGARFSLLIIFAANDKAFVLRHAANVAV